MSAIIAEISAPAHRRLSTIAERPAEMAICRQVNPPYSIHTIYCREDHHMHISYHLVHYIDVDPSSQYGRNGVNLTFFAKYMQYRVTLHT